MDSPRESRLRRLSRKWFPDRKAARRRQIHAAVFLSGIVCLVLGFELLRVVPPVDLAGNPVVDYGPYGYLLLWIGAALTLIGFGYLATPLVPWSGAPKDWGGIERLPVSLGTERERIAGEGRTLAIVLLVAGLLLLEALPMYGLATSTQLFDRTNCTSNCAALRPAEVAFLLDLVPIAIADAFIVIMLFVFIPP